MIERAQVDAVSCGVPVDVISLLPETLIHGAV